MSVQQKPFKSSWVDSVPAHWEQLRLGRMARIYAGGTPDKANAAFWGGGIPWLNSGTVNQWMINEPSEYITELGYDGSSARWVPKGALVMALAGQGKTKGMCAQLGIDATCNQSMAAILPDFGVSRYLLYWLSANYRNIRGMASDDLRDGLNLVLLGQIPVPVPPIDEQKAIAAYLDRETARIDELMREKEGLMGLLREMIAGETTRVMTEGLSPSVELKQTSRPWFKYIPAHWELVQIRHVLGSGRGSMRAGPFGSQMTSNDMVDSGVKVYAQRHVIDNDFAQGENFVSKKKADEMTAFFVQPGDVLFTTRGTIGRCAVIPDGAEMGVLHPCLIRVRFDESRIRNDFVQYLVNSTEFFGRQLKEKSNATTIEVVYTDNLRAVVFPLPPLDEQKAIVEHLDRETARIDTLIAHVQDEIKLLQELRAATITDAVTGKIQVS